MTLPSTPTVPGAVISPHLPNATIRSLMLHQASPSRTCKARSKGPPGGVSRGTDSVTVPPTPTCRLPAVSFFNVAVISSPRPLRRAYRLTPSPIDSTRAVTATLASTRARNAGSFFAASTSRRVTGRTDASSNLTEPACLAETPAAPPINGAGSTTDMSGMSSRQTLKYP